MIFFSESPTIHPQLYSSPVNFFRRRLFTISQDSGGITGNSFDIIFDENYCKTKIQSAEGYDSLHLLNTFRISITLLCRERRRGVRTTQNYDKYINYFTTKSLHLFKYKATKHQSKRFVTFQGNAQSLILLHQP